MTTWQFWQLQGYGIGIRKGKKYAHLALRNETDTRTIHVSMDYDKFIKATKNIQTMKLKRKVTK